MTPSMYIKLGAAAAILILLIGTHSAAYRAGGNSVRLDWERERLVHAQALTAQEAAHRAQERKWGEATAKLTESLRGAQERLQNEMETIIADRDAGTLRLRDDLRGCRAQLPGDPPTPSGDHGAGGGGLSEARQGVLIRVAAECDAVVNRLRAAQGYIRALQPTP
jgi:hypothetical protein